MAKVVLVVSTYILGTNFTMSAGCRGSQSGLRTPGYKEGRRERGKNLISALLLLTADLPYEGGKVGGGRG